MRLKQIALAGMMGLATMAPLKAQNPLKFTLEAGLNGQLAKEVSLMGGLNISHETRKNFADVFVGMNTNGTKNLSFTGLFIENFSWTKNISSWFRGIGTASNKNINATADISPIRGNVSAGKFNFALNPSYALYADYKNRALTQGLGAIFQTTYAITPADKLFLELRYGTTPAKNIADTQFGPIKDNMSYMVTFQKTF